MKWLPRRVRIAIAVACAAGALASIAFGKSASGQLPAASPSPPQAAAPSATALARGRTLYGESCASCHGIGLTGVRDRGPSLRGVGARAADFYLSTGRMPLDSPGQEPQRHPPAFKRPDIDALVAYVASFGGPPIPRANPANGDLSEGQRLFADHCSGCHQIAGQGGMITGAQVPDLSHASNTEIAEAVRIGPYLMPPFSTATIDQQQLDSIAKYIAYARHPKDAGGWSIGRTGPIPEGMVTWLLAMVALILAVRLIGERTPE